MKRDPSLDALLDLDGQVLVVDPGGDHWVRFVVRRVTVSEARPHGLDYTLSLHDARGERLVGFDNAHGVRERAGPGGGKRRARVPPSSENRSALRLQRRRDPAG